MRCSSQFHSCYLRRDHLEATGVDSNHLKSKVIEGTERFAAIYFPSIAISNASDSVGVTLTLAV